MKILQANAQNSEFVAGWQSQCRQEDLDIVNTSAEFQRGYVAAFKHDEGYDPCGFAAELSAAEVDQILAHVPAFEAKADQDAYNWGWTAWGLGLCSDHLEGIALQGWQDAEDAYAEERAAERQMFAQLVNGY